MIEDNNRQASQDNIIEMRWVLNRTELSRGCAHAGDGRGSFLRIANTPPTPLGGADGIFPAESVRLFLKVGNYDTGPHYLTVPYNAESARYEIEL